MKENVDYEFVPLEDDPEHWAVRILTGDFVETVIRFDAIRIDGTSESMKFSFTILQKSDIIVTEENEQLQLAAAAILEKIIERGIDEGSVKFKDVDADES